MLKTFWVLVLSGLVFVWGGCDQLDGLLNQKDKDKKKNAAVDPAAGSGKVKEGFFQDSAVEGLDYVSGSQKGTTDFEGRFMYEEGKNILFTLGDIRLGEAKGQNVITPADFMVDPADVNKPVAINISRLLLSLDDDRNPDNGIHISKEVSAAAAGMSLGFNVSAAEFEQTAGPIIEKLLGVRRELVSSQFAADHLIQTINQTPGLQTIIYLSNNRVVEHAPIGTVVGSILGGSTSGDPVQKFEIIGQTVKDVFKISGVDIQIADSQQLDSILHKTMVVSIRSTTVSGKTYTQDIQIQILDGASVPKSIQLSSTTLEENPAPGTVVGTFTTASGGTGGKIRYTLVTGQEFFDVIEDTILVVKAGALIDHELTPILTFKVRVTNEIEAFSEEDIELTIVDKNEAATAVVIKRSGTTLLTLDLNENMPAGTVLGQLESDDPDLTNSAFHLEQFELVQQIPPDAFMIEGANLKVKDASKLNYETLLSHKIILKIRVIDTDKADLLSAYTQEFSIKINDVDEAPEGIQLSNTGILEGVSTNNQRVGVLSAKDPEGARKVTFALLEQYAGYELTSEALVQLRNYRRTQEWAQAFLLIQKLTHQRFMTHEEFRDALASVVTLNEADQIFVANQAKQRILKDHYRLSQQNIEGLENSQLISTMDIVLYQTTLNKVLNALKDIPYETQEQFLTAFRINLRNQFTIDVYAPGSLAKEQLYQEVLTVTAQKNQLRDQQDGINKTLEEEKQSIESDPVQKSAVEALLGGLVEKDADDITAQFQELLLDAAREKVPATPFEIRSVDSGIWMADVLPLIFEANPTITIAVQAFDEAGVGSAVQELVIAVNSRNIALVNPNVSVGKNHACNIIQPEGKVQCWGAGQAGQLGEGNDVSQSTPVEVDNVSNLALSAGFTPNDTSISFVKQVSSGGYFSCFALSNGEVECSGSGFKGQLGNNSLTSSSRPVAVEEADHTPLKDVVYVASGELHSCALTVSNPGLQNESRLVKCWGDGAFGQLGNNDNVPSDHAVPVTIRNADGNPARVIQVVSGEFHTCVLLIDRSVQCWGAGNHGQLGDGRMRGSATPVKVLNIKHVVQLAAGHSHTCAVRVDGKLYCWGDASSDQLGLLDTKDFIDRSKTPATKPVATTAASNAQQSSVQDLPDEVNSFGKKIVPKPILVKGIQDAVKISAGSNHTCAILKDRRVQCWGDSSHGENGLPATGGTSTPHDLGKVATAKEISSSHNTNCIITIDNKTECWGDGSDGELGNGKHLRTHRATPVQNRSVGIASGQNHTCVLLQDKTVRCFGSNALGQLGNGSDKINLVQVGFLNTASQISTGSHHNCAVLPGGLLQCWGAGGLGQLGQGKFENSTAPVAVKGLTGVVEVATGGEHSCARTSTGTVFCWGRGDRGQIGDPSFISRNQPIQVTGVINAVGLALGTNHSCALLSTQETVCWGDNNVGQLGSEFTPELDPESCATNAKCSQLAIEGPVDSNNNPPFFPFFLDRRSASPRKVTAIGGRIRQITSGDNHICAILYDSSVACWGDYRQHQMEVDANVACTKTTIANRVLVIEDKNKPYKPSLVMWSDSNGTLTEAFDYAKFEGVTDTNFQTLNASPKEDYPDQCAIEAQQMQYIPAQININHKYDAAQYPENGSKDIKSVYNGTLRSNRSNHANRLNLGFVPFLSFVRGGVTASKLVGGFGAPALYAAGVGFSIGAAVSEKYADRDVIFLRSERGIEVKPNERPILCGSPDLLASLSERSTSAQLVQAQLGRSQRKEFLLTAAKIAFGLLGGAAAGAATADIDGTKCFFGVQSTTEIENTNQDYTAHGIKSDLTDDIVSGAKDFFSADSIEDFFNPGSHQTANPASPSELKEATDICAAGTQGEGFLKNNVFDDFALPKQKGFFDITQKWNGDAIKPIQTITRDNKETTIRYTDKNSYGLYKETREIRKNNNVDSTITIDQGEVQDIGRALAFLKNPTTINYKDGDGAGFVGGAVTSGQLRSLETVIKAKKADGTNENFYDISTSTWKSKEVMGDETTFTDHSFVIKGDQCFLTKVVVKTIATSSKTEISSYTIDFSGDPSGTSFLDATVVLDPGKRCYVSPEEVATSGIRNRYKVSKKIEKIRRIAGAARPSLFDIYSEGSYVLSDTYTHPTDSFILGGTSSVQMLSRLLVSTSNEENSLSSIWLSNLREYVNQDNKKVLAGSLMKRLQNNVFGEAVVAKADLTAVTFSPNEVICSGTADEVLKCSGISTIKGVDLFRDRIKFGSIVVTQQVTATLAKQESQDIYGSREFCPVSQKILPGQAIRPQITSAKAITAGRTHTCAVVVGEDPSREAIKCWGRGDFGQLGDEQPLKPLNCSVKNVDDELDGAVQGGKTKDSAFSAAIGGCAIGSALYGAAFGCIAGGSIAALIGNQDAGKTLSTGLSATLGGLGKYTTSGIKETLGKIPGFFRMNPSLLPPREEIIYNLDTRQRVRLDRQSTLLLSVNGYDESNTRLKFLFPGVAGLVTAGIVGGSYFSSVARKDNLKEDKPLIQSVFSDEFVKCDQADPTYVYGMHSVNITAGNPEVPSGTILQITAGAQHTCALLNNQDRVRCWGRNVEGQVGTPISDTLNGSLALSASKPAINSDTSIQTSCITSTGAQKPITDSECLDTGSSNEPGFSKPRNVQGISTIPNVTRIAAGDSHTCGVLQDGSVRCWGENISGQLGNADRADFASIAPVQDASGAPLFDVEQITAGGFHTCVILKDRSVWCWGNGQQGQLGDGIVKESYKQNHPVQALVDNAIGITAGLYHTCALRLDGTVWCWGNAVLGQMGKGKIERDNFGVPQQVMVHRLGTSISKDNIDPTDTIPLTGIEQISAGSNHTCAVHETGMVYCWGSGEHRVLGNGIRYNATAPPNLLSDAWQNDTLRQSLITALGVWLIFGNPTGVLFGRRIGTTAAGAIVDGAAVTNAKILTGAVVLGGLGIIPANITTELFGTPEPVINAPGAYLPTLVNEIQGAIRVSSGDREVCAIMFDQTIRCWGEPIRENVIGILPGLVNFVAPTLQTYGKNAFLYLFGNSACGLASAINKALCENPEPKDNIPPTTTRKTGVDSPSQLVAGAGHNCALEESGKVKCWGLGGNGQLGTGKFENTFIPKEVTGIDNAISLSAGSNFTCALLEDGRVKCWGEGSLNQLGPAIDGRNAKPVDLGFVTFGMGIYTESTEVKVGQSRDHDIFIVNGAKNNLSINEIRGALSIVATESNGAIANRNYTDPDFWKITPDGDNIKVSIPLDGQGVVAGATDRITITLRKHFNIENDFSKVIQVTSVPELSTVKPF